MNASLYIHIPVCRRRCDYCDFFTRTRVSAAVQNELVQHIVAQWNDHRDRYRIDAPATVYVGGGTPSALEEPARDRLFELISSITGGYRTNGLREVTVEVNPEDVDTRLLEELRGVGVTRLSLGVQSLMSKTLTTIGRHTSLEDTIHGLEVVAGDWRLPWNADAIVAIPGQSGEEARSDLEALLEFGPDHLSIYELELVPSTVLGQAARTGRLRPLPEEQAERLVLGCSDYLEERGYEQYEVSNFARPGQRSEHNSRYWRIDPYLGIGPGAVGTMPSPDGNGPPLRLEGPRSFAAFRSNPDFGVTTQSLTASEFCRETIMMAFRTREGIATERFAHIFGYRLDEAMPKTLDRWSTRVKNIEGRIALDRDGLRIVNAFVRDAFGEIDENPPPYDVPRWPASIV